MSEIVQVSRLSDRKAELVASLVRDGKTNAEIAETLGVSKGSATNYVSEARKKIPDMPRRDPRPRQTQAVRLAAQGKSLTEIAGSMGISYLGALSHMMRARQRIDGAAATFAALVKAVDAGDCEAAAGCQRDLDAAGWIVRRKPRTA